MLKRGSSPSQGREEEMVTDQLAETWAIRSTLVTVTELDRSLTFYREIGRFEEIARDDTVVVLGQIPRGSMFIILRQVQSRHAVRYGQDSLGVRSMTFNVRSVGELDRIEPVLRRHGLFTRRWNMADGAAELMTGRDPDNLPLAFGSYDESRLIGTEYYGEVAGFVHSLDV
jgi:hypothetical protein